MASSRRRGLRLPSAAVTIRAYREKFDADELLRRALVSFENEFEAKSIALAGTFERSFTIRLSKTIVDRVPKWWLQHEIDKAGYDVEWETSEAPEMVLRITLRTRPKKQERAPPLPEELTLPLPPPPQPRMRPVPRPVPASLRVSATVLREDSEDEAEEAGWYAVRDEE